MNPDHLLEQAAGLAASGAGRPRSADLRRAVSGAYYAVFHHRVRSATERALSKAGDARGARALLSRGYSHEAFRGISQHFGGGVGCWPPWMRGVIEDTGFTVPPELRESCRLFVALQDRRHAADYDPAWQPDRTLALATVEEARRAISRFEAARGTTARRLYLAAAPLWEALRKRRGG